MECCLLILSKLSLIHPLVLRCTAIQNTLLLGKFNMTPKLPIHKMENIGKAFEWMEKVYYCFAQFDSTSNVENRNPIPADRR